MALFSGPYYVTWNKHMFFVFISCGFIISCGFTWCIYQYFSGLVHWHWAHSRQDITLKAMGKNPPIPNHNKAYITRTMGVSLAFVLHSRRNMEVIYRNLLKHHLKGSRKVYQICLRVYNAFDHHVIHGKHRVSVSALKRFSEGYNLAPIIAHQIEVCIQGVKCCFWLNLSFDMFTCLT